MGILNYTNSVLQITLSFLVPRRQRPLRAALSNTRSRAVVSECDRVVSGPMLDQAIKRGFIAENKLNRVVAEFSLVHQLSPLGGLSLTSSPPVAPSVSKGVVWTL